MEEDKNQVSNQTYNNYNNMNPAADVVETGNVYRGSMPKPVEFDDDEDDMDEVKASRTAYHATRVSVPILGPDGKPMAPIKLDDDVIKNEAHVQSVGVNPTVAPIVESSPVVENNVPVDPLTPVVNPPVDIPVVKTAPAVDTTPKSSETEMLTEILDQPEIQVVQPQEPTVVTSAPTVNPALKAFGWTQSEETIDSGKSM